MWGMYFHLEFAFYAGRSLEAIEADYRVYVKQMKEFNQLRAAALSSCIWQTVLNLMGHAKMDPCELTGEVMDQDSLCEESKIYNETTIRRMQMTLAFFFGNHELGSQLAFDYGEETPSQHPGTPAVAQCRFYCAVSCFDMAIKTKKQKYIKYGKRYMRMIKQWVEKGSPNVTHYEKLLDAELAVVEGRNHVAVKHYESAALLAARKGFIQDQAVINERFGQFLLHTMKDPAEAEYRFSEAAKLYDEWGAAGKVKQLRDRHSNT